MLCDGMFSIQPVHPMMVMEFSPVPCRAPPSLMNLIDDVFYGSQRRMANNNFTSCGVSHSCPHPLTRRSTFEQSHPLSLLLDCVLSNNENKTKGNGVNIPVGLDKDTRGKKESKNEESSPVTPSSQNSTTESRQNISKTKGDVAEDIHQDVTSVNKDSDNTKKEEGEGERESSKGRHHHHHPWQFEVGMMERCDQVRAFVERGVLTVDGRQRSGDRRTEVRHSITIPSTVDPDTLTATFTKDGRLIVSQRETGTVDAVTDLTIVKEIEEETKKDDQKGVSSGKENSKEEEKENRNGEEKPVEEDRNKQESIPAGDDNDSDPIKNDNA